MIDRTRHAVARSWLPGELLARLGRDAARLLDAEVQLAESDPVPAGRHCSVWAGLTTRRIRLPGGGRGQGSLPDGPAYAELALRGSGPSQGSDVGFVVHSDRLTCWGWGKVLSRQDDTLVLGDTHVYGVLPAQGDRDRWTPSGRQTLSLTGEDSLLLTWSAGIYELTMSPDGTALTRRAWGRPRTVEHLRQIS